MKFPAVVSRALSVFRTKAQSLSAISGTGGWFRIIGESFTGAFQQHVAIDAPKDILAYSGVFAPLTLIAADIAKLRIKIVEEGLNGICTEIKKNLPWLAVLYKPNRYQTRIKFIEQWIVSKLLYGNTYVLKQRDGRGIVTDMYILDAQRVTPLVSESGDVYYALAPDHLSGLVEAVTVPASEIIHDRMCCLWHPLVGISPIYACGMSATQGRKIQVNSTKFFGNMSRPSGVLTAPGQISDEEALKMKNRWEENYGPNGAGGTAVLGNGLSYATMVMNAVDAQLIQQLEWTVKDIAACFHMPLFKVGGPVPVGSTVAALQQMYYNDCLHSLIEDLEACLDDGLSLPGDYYTEMDLENLLRMDQVAQMTMLVDSVKGAIRSPDEARAKINLLPVAGGNSPYLQQQNFSLEALAKRDALPNPFVLDKPERNPTPSAAGPAATADPTAGKDAEAAHAMADIFIKGLQADYAPA